MPIDKSIIKDGLRNDVKSIDLSQEPDEVHEQLVNILADRLEEFLLSADLVIASGSSAGTYKLR